MNHTKSFFAILISLAIIIALLAAGCSAQETSTSESAAGAAHEPSLAETMDTTTDEELIFEAPPAEDCADGIMQSPADPYSNEEYGQYSESPFLSPMDAPLSTFSIDVDTASYSNIRRYLSDGMLPPEDAVRIEECLNYFGYDYPGPTGAPVGIDVTIGDCPWNPGRYLARVTVKAQELDLSETPSGNIVFLLDVSGSMDSPDKLPLVKSALTMLTNNLNEDDTISIVVYAGASGVVLNGCCGDDTKQIEWALDQLSAGGSTAGGEGIELAYRIAEQHYIDGGNNRVILCTDGDFNVGPSSMNELEDLIEEKRDSGVFLSVLGFGTGNTKDNKMETLADKGNGNYAYIDSLMEAKKVLVSEMASTLYTVAKDVKIQIEFNPAAVSEYRLVGYDNRLLAAEDFNNDKKDAGEMGAGHTVTAFYEIILNGSGLSSSNVDDLVFQENDTRSADTASADDWMYVKLRYKLPDENTSQKLTLWTGIDDYTRTPDDDFLFATAVAEFALILKDSPYMGAANMDDAISRARDARGYDADGYRSQFIQLAEIADQLLR